MIIMSSKINAEVFKKRSFDQKMAKTAHQYSLLFKIQAESVGIFLGATKLKFREFTSRILRLI